MTFSALIAHLEGAMRRPLPGTSAQQRMAPRVAREWPADVNPARIRTAAGLLLLVPIDEAAHVVLTVRAGALGRHGGQVSLPGGVMEAGETVEQTARREAHEEIGLTLDQVRTLGPLTPVDIIVSGFRLHPILALATERPTLRPTDSEVARILEVDVRALMDPTTLVWRSLIRGDSEIGFPAFAISGVEIWGATAMVLSEFLALVGWQGPPEAW